MVILPIDILLLIQLLYCRDTRKEIRFQNTECRLIKKGEFGGGEGWTAPWWLEPVWEEKAATQMVGLGARWGDV